MSEVTSEATEVATLLTSDATEVAILSAPDAIEVATEMMSEMTWADAKGAARRGRRMRGTRMVSIGWGVCVWGGGGGLCLCGALRGKRWGAKTDWGLETRTNKEVDYE